MWESSMTCEERVRDTAKKKACAALNNTVAETAVAVSKRHIKKCALRFGSI